MTLPSLELGKMSRCRNSTFASNAGLKRLNQFGKVEFLFYLNREMIWVDEVSKSLGGELEQPEISAVAVQQLNHCLSLIMVSALF